MDTKHMEIAGEMFLLMKLYDAYVISRSQFKNRRASMCVCEIRLAGGFSFCL